MIVGNTVECQVCGHVDEPQIRGSLWITVILLVVFFPAAIVYEIWRRSSDKVCENCGSFNIQIYQPHHSLNQIERRPFNNRVNRGRKKDGKTGLLLVVLVLLILVAIVFLKVDSNNSISQAPVVEQKKDIHTTPSSTTISNYQSSQTSSSSSSDIVGFDECKSKTRSVLLSVAGTQYKSAVLVDSDIAYMVRICTNDGSVLVTCSAPDQKMITTRSYDCPL